MIDTRITFNDFFMKIEAPRGICNTYFEIYRESLIRDYQPFSMPYFHFL